jgi:hypothetical protein
MDLVSEFNMDVKCLYDSGVRLVSNYSYVSLSGLKDHGVLIRPVLKLMKEGSLGLTVSMVVSFIF